MDRNTPTELHQAPSCTRCYDTFSVHLSMIDLPSTSSVAPTLLHLYFLPVQPGWLPVQALQDGPVVALLTVLKTAQFHEGRVV